MNVLPKEVIDAFDNKRKEPVVLTTVDSEGLPNAIYATCVKRFGDNRIVIADNYFDKTRKNIFSGSKGSILFITDNKVAFQIKGTLEYHKDGEIFEDMKKWNPVKHPGHGALALKVEEVYSGSKKLL